MKNVISSRFISYNKLNPQSSSLQTGRTDAMNTLKTETEALTPSDVINTSDRTHTQEEEYTAVAIDDKQNAISPWDKSKGFKAKLKLCAKDVWGRKSVYLPLISHLSDTCTDFAAVVEFGIVAAHSNADDCKVNVRYLFTLSIMCMVVYRVISSYKIYEITGSTWRVLMQFIDIEIYRVLYVAHSMGLNGTSSPQRLLSTLEACFEAAPQSTIQIVYLMLQSNMLIMMQSNMYDAIEHADHDAIEHV
eukprot:889113_1